MFPTRKLTFGLIYGLTAGLIFAVSAWGLNGYLLSTAHFAHPWLTFLLGLLPSLLIAGLAGYLTIRLDSAWLGGICWLIAGILMGILGIWLPLGFIPGLLIRLEPVLKGWSQFTWVDAYVFLVYSASLAVGVAFLIAGLLETVLIEQTSFSPSSGAIVVPVLVCTLFSVVAGGVVDNLANVRFRDSVTVLDELFSFAIDNQGKNIDAQIERRMHMGAISTIQKDLSRERRLFYFSYDGASEQAKILVDFKGRWALCDMSQNQPVFCRAVQPPQ